MFILKSFRQPIPGNYYYVQTFGIVHTFDANPMVEEVAKAVSSFRIANKLPRASLVESLEDVDVFTCARLLNNPNFCRECENSWFSVHSDHPFIKKPCASCGTPSKTS
jgi:hypothetical protein